MPKRQFKPMKHPSHADALRSLRVLYADAELEAKLALYRPFVGTGYKPRSWLQAALFTAAGGDIS